jgi:hypothetical protein
MELKKVNENFRGESWILTDERLGEMVIHFTRAGFARGGVSHDQQERFIIIDGTIKINGDELRRAADWDSDFFIDPDDLHYFVSETDSIVFEIHPLNTKTEYDPEMRKKVEDINSNKRSKL